MSSQEEILAVVKIGEEFTRKEIAQRLDVERKAIDNATRRLLSSRRFVKTGEFGDELRNPSEILKRVE